MSISALSFEGISLKMTITVGVTWGEVSALMAYIKQSFQKFFILLFVRMPSPHEESHVQIFSESTGDDELLLSSCLILSHKVFRVFTVRTLSWKIMHLTSWQNVRELLLTS